MIDSLKVPPHSTSVSLQFQRQFFVSLSSESVVSDLPRRNELGRDDEAMTVGQILLHQARVVSLPILTDLRVNDLSKEELRRLVFL